MAKLLALTVAAAAYINAVAAAPRDPRRPTGLVVQVTAADGLLNSTTDGRLMVMFAPPTELDVYQHRPALHSTTTHTLHNQIRHIPRNEQRRARGA